MEKCVFNDRLSFFISSFTPDNSALCERVGAEARKRGVPVIRREAEGFLKMLLSLKKPERILEIGTAVGYSTLIMAENTPEECKITTIEIGEDDARRAVENFKEAGVSDRVESSGAMLQMCCRPSPVSLILYFWMHRRGSTLDFLMRHGGFLLPAL